MSTKHTVTPPPAGEDAGVPSIHLRCDVSHPAFGRRTHEACMPVETRSGSVERDCLEAVRAAVDAFVRTKGDGARMRVSDVRIVPESLGAVRAGADRDPHLAFVARHIEALVRYEAAKAIHPDVRFKEGAGLRHPAAPPDEQGRLSAARDFIEASDWHALYAASAGINAGEGSDKWEVDRAAVVDAARTPPSERRDKTVRYDDTMDGWKYAVGLIDALPDRPEGGALSDEAVVIGVLAREFGRQIERTGIGAETASTEGAVWARVQAEATPPEKWIAFCMRASALLRVRADLASQADTPAAPAEADRGFGPGDVGIKGPAASYPEFREGHEADPATPSFR